MEIKYAVILAAGNGKRMGDLTNKLPKSFLKYNDEVICNRMIRQLTSVGVKHITIVLGYNSGNASRLLAKEYSSQVQIVLNNEYATDASALSLNKALSKIIEPVVVLEGDSIFEDALLEYVVSKDFDNKSVMFSNGMFKEPQYGAVIRSENDMLVKEYASVPRFNTKYTKFSKYANILRISKNELPLFKQILKKEVKAKYKPHFVDVWGNNIDKLETYEGNLEYYKFGTYNTETEFNKIQKIIFDTKQIHNRIYDIVDVETLIPIEQYEPENVEKLLKKITLDEVWLTPIRIETVNNFIIDGHHRYEVAQRLGLKKVPVQKFEMSEIEVWSVRKTQVVDKTTIKKRISNRLVYPPRTAKFKVPNVKNECAVRLNELID